MAHDQSRDLKRALARLRKQLASPACVPGTSLPKARTLAARHGVGRTVIEQALKTLDDSGEVTRMGTSYFAGSPELTLSPNFERSHQLASLYGEYFSLRTEEPERPVHLNVCDFRGARGTRVHAHDFHEIALIHSGVGHHLHNGTHYPLNPGDCFLVPPGEKHGFESGKGLDMTVVVFYIDYLEPVLDQLAAIPGFTRFFALGPPRQRKAGVHEKLHLSPAQHKRLVEIIGDLQRELTDKAPCYEAVAVAELVRLVAFLGRCAGGASGAPASEIGVYAGDAVEAARAYVEQHLAEPLHVEGIAGSAFVSPSRLHHLFSERLGCSVMEYVTRVRLDHAVTLLTATQSAVSRISQECGFLTPSHFSRVFTAHYKLTPRRYRLRQAGTQNRVPGTE